MGGAQQRWKLARKVVSFLVDAPLFNGGDLDKGEHTLAFLLEPREEVPTHIQGVTLARMEYFTLPPPLPESSTGITLTPPPVTTGASTDSKYFY